MKLYSRKSYLIKEVIIRLFFALIQPYLEYCFQFWISQYKKDGNTEKHIQLLAPKLSGLKHLLCVKAGGLCLFHHEEVVLEKFNCSLSVAVGSFLRDAAHLFT